LPASQQPPIALVNALTDPTNSKFISITRVSDEISVVCDYTILPNGTQSDEWKCIKIVGPMDLCACERCVFLDILLICSSSS